jgi:hypothetical protein
MSEEIKELTLREDVALRIFIASISDDKNLNINSVDYCFECADLFLSGLKQDRETV